MATRKELTRVRRIDDRILEGLRGSIRRTVPWIIPVELPARGHADLIFLVEGLYYPVCDYIRSVKDEEISKEIWWELRQDILNEHIKHRPLTRPWSFYALEDREPRRRPDRKPCKCPLDGRQHPGLPPQSMSWFGRIRGCRCEYESEASYLKRLRLLLPDEKTAE
jgi:hypothetical protein